MLNWVPWTNYSTEIGQILHEKSQIELVFLDFLLYFDRPPLPHHRSYAKFICTNGKLRSSSLIWCLIVYGVTKVLSMRTLQKFGLDDFHREMEFSPFDHLSLINRRSLNSGPMQNVRMAVESWDIDLSFDTHKSSLRRIPRLQELCKKG